MKIFFRALTILAALIALVWLYKDPKFDSAFATCVALAAVFALFMTPRNKKQPTQSQTIEGNSTGIQAGGDITVGTISTSESSKDAE